MAEAAAVIGLAASIASLVDLSSKIISRLHEFSSKTAEIPKSFRSLSARLPLLTATLVQIQSQAEAGRFPDDVLSALNGVVKDTTKQVYEVQILLVKVLPTEGASKFERAFKAVKSLAREEKLQQASERIHKNNDILVLHQTTRHVDTGDQILEALSKLSVGPSTKLSPSSTIPFCRDPDFVDRGSLVDQLLDKCALPASRTALVGLGGVGKSQLAIEVGHRIRERSPETWTLWIHAGSAARFEQSFRDIADLLELPGRQEAKANVFKLVRDWLRSERSGRWLLILDNVDNPNLIPEDGDAGQSREANGADCEGWQPVTAYLPQSQNGSILITSRSQAVTSKIVEAKDVVAVEPMASAQALMLFEKKLGSLGQSEDTAALAAALEFMPLAIVQAAAYISQRAPRSSVGQYLENFQRSDRQKSSLLQHEGGQLRRDWQAHSSILITWQISFAHIQEIRPSAAGLLSLMSFFDRQGIPEELVRSSKDAGRSENQAASANPGDEKDHESDEDDASRDSEDDGFEDDIQILRNYSFVSVDTDGTFEMHALVQLAMRKWLQANEQLEVWRQRYITELSSRFPVGVHENWRYCQALFPHAKSALAQRPVAETSLREWASLLYNAGWYAWQKGSVADAIALSENAMEARKTAFGPEQEETLASMVMLASAYTLGGRLGEAEELLVKDVEISQSTLGQEHEHTLNAMNNLAGLYSESGRWKQAEALQEQVLEAEIRVLGREDPKIPIAMNNLAITFLHQGLLNEAERLQKQALWQMRRAPGYRHPDTLITMSNLARTFREQGKYEVAEALNKETLAIQREVLGEDHPHTLHSMAGLASAFQEQRRWKEAQRLHEHVLELRTRLLGEEHPDTLSSMCDLAGTYLRQGYAQKAEKLEVTVLKIEQRVLGSEHPSTLTTMNNHAYTLKAQRRNAEAISLMRKCAQGRARVLGPEHQYTKESQNVVSRWENGKL